MDVTTELRLTTPGYGTLVENFVSSDGSRIQDKIREWESDGLNRGYIITGYVWAEGERTESASREIH